ncbi:unnamed protein product [Soboliphyme baturini]|uniref:Uncharacterized protein n=1 Tax=Soboliphyme baturini TaxID=241478 RepID=A0A183IQV5_9BILA|nr:unnamed protein product [Soboliphyme baturini]
MRDVRLQEQVPQRVRQHMPSRQEPARGRLLHGRVQLQDDGELR